MMIAAAAVAVSLGAVQWSCGGEVTELNLGGERQIDFDRYREEIQPVLEADLGPGDAEAGIGLRSCVEPFCHGGVNGVGGVPPLRIVKNPDDAALVENFRQVTSRIDAVDGAASILLTDPLNEGDPAPHGGGKNFNGTGDCCYQLVLAWINDEDKPGCACPPE